MSVILDFDPVACEVDDDSHMFGIRIPSIGHGFRQHHRHIAVEAPSPQCFRTFKLKVIQNWTSLRDLGLRPMQTDGSAHGSPELHGYRIVDQAGRDRGWSRARSPARMH